MKEFFCCRYFVIGFWFGVVWVSVVEVLVWIGGVYFVWRNEIGGKRWYIKKIKRNLSGILFMLLVMVWICCYKVDGKKVFVDLYEDVNWMCEVWCWVFGLWSD